MGTSACDPGLPADGEAVRRVLAGETAAYEAIMRRHNQRLFRAARAILRDEDEAEDVLQETYLRAYQHLGEFAGEAQLSTWLTRIAVNEALARLRRRQRAQNRAGTGPARSQAMDAFESPNPGPERLLLEAETRRLLEAAIDALPDAYRLVFVLREVEGMNTSEVAACLGMTEDNAKIRLHRARRMLRRELWERTGAASAQAFTFLGERCDRVVRSVLRALER